MIIIELYRLASVIIYYTYEDHFICQISYYPNYKFTDKQMETRKQLGTVKVLIQYHNLGAAYAG